VTVKAPQVGAVEERAEAEDREWDLEEGGWAVPDRAPALEGNVCAHNAAPPPLTKPESRAFRSNAPSVAQPWSENSKYAYLVYKYRIWGKYTR